MILFSMGTVNTAHMHSTTASSMVPEPDGIHKVELGLVRCVVGCWGSVPNIVSKFTSTPAWAAGWVGVSFQCCPPSPLHNTTHNTIPSTLPYGRRGRGGADYK